MHGWLEKEGHKVHTWKRRYFFLSKKGILSYYEDADMQMKRGELDVSSAEVTKPKKARKNKDFVFRVSTPSEEKMILSALSEEDFQKWMDAIDGFSHGDSKAANAPASMRRLTSMNTMVSRRPKTGLAATTAAMGVAVDDIGYRAPPLLRNGTDHTSTVVDSSVPVFFHEGYVKKSVGKLKPIEVYAAVSARYLYCFVNNYDLQRPNEGFDLVHCTATKPVRQERSRCSFTVSQNNELLGQTTVWTFTFASEDEMEPWWLAIRKQITVACYMCVRGSSGVSLPRLPLWLNDRDVVDCMECGVMFTSLRRRHHCRLCGYIYCGLCSAGRRHIPRGENGLSRVCTTCEESLVVLAASGF